MSTNIEFNTPLSIDRYAGHSLVHDMSGGMFSDGGADIFDNWGAFTIRDSLSNELLLPIDNTDNNTTNTLPFTLGIGAGNITYGYIDDSIYYFEIIPDDPQWTYDLSFGGSYGSDAATQSGTVFRNVAEDTYRIWLHWNNDGPMDAIGADPQWMYAIVPEKKILSNPSTQPYTTTYTITDREAVSCVGLSGTVRFYGFAGGSTDAALDAIVSQIDIYEAYYNAVTVLSPTRYWRLGEVDGTDAVDKTGNCDGTYMNHPALGVDGLTLDSDTSVAFSITSYVRCAESKALISGGRPFSISLLFNRTSIGDSHLINIPDSEDSWVIANIGSNRGDYGDITFGSNSRWHKSKITLGTPLLDDVTYHLTITYNGEDRGSIGSYSAYIDGVAQIIEPSADIPSEASSDFYIGKKGSESDSGFHGIIDDVAFFNYELLGVHALALYNASIALNAEDFLLNPLQMGLQESYRKRSRILDQFQHAILSAPSLILKEFAIDGGLITKVFGPITDRLSVSHMFNPTEITDKPRIGPDKHVGSDDLPTIHMRSLNNLSGAHINGSLVKDYFIGEDRIYGNILNGVAPTVGRALLFDQDNMQLIAQQTGTSYDFYNIDQTLTYMLMVYHVDNPEVINPVIINNIKLDSI